MGKIKYLKLVVVLIGSLKFVMKFWNMMIKILSSIKLRGFIALCNDCHMIKHNGFAQIQESKGLLDMNILIKHFLKINKVKISDFEKHSTQQWQIWEERSKHAWKTEFGEWSNLIKKYN
jgi:hypothetical protein